MRYAAPDQLSFRDPQGREWRIRRADGSTPLWRPRWRVEQAGDAGWVLRDTAFTKKLAQDRMRSLWAARDSG